MQKTTELTGNMAERYHPFLIDVFPDHRAIEAFNRVSMAEGNTPLVQAGASTLEYLAARGITGVNVLYKPEWRNPTGSFKDRGMAVAVAKALKEEVQALICASTGNTSASAAAYGTRAGLKVYVLIPEGVPDTKVQQAIAYGATIVRHGKDFDEAQEAAIKLADRFSEVRLVNSINPDRLEGQKTAAFEISDELGKAPHYLAIPVGNAGNITAYWKGFTEYNRSGQNKTTPTLIGGRAMQGTAAQAIAISNPKNKMAAYNAANESGGVIFEGVLDSELIEAHAALRKDGQLTELASAMSLAVLPRYAKLREIPKESTLVLVLTGNGLKDLDRSINTAVKKELGLEGLVRELNSAGLLHKAD